MKSVPVFFLNILSSLVLVSFFACHHKADLSVAPPKPPDPGPEFKCSHDTVYFKNSVYPLVLTGCAKTGCHDQSSGKSDLVLDNYQNIMELVKPFDPQGSKLYYVLFSNPEGRMPQDGPFSMDQKSVIYWWIAQGAYNNGCDSVGCDSTNVTYTLTINPIIQTWCINCHSGSNPSGNIALATYDEVVSCANSGKLMGAIRHDQGFKPMPQGGSMLPPCEIALFEKWIRTGKP
jgi:hypothetical protein